MFASYSWTLAFPNGNPRAAAAIISTTIRREQVVALVKGHDPLPEYQVKDALRALSLLGGESGKD